MSFKLYIRKKPIKAPVHFNKYIMQNNTILEIFEFTDGSRLFKSINSCEGKIFCKNNNIVYTGELFNKLPHGSGCLSWFDDKYRYLYKGTFCHGSHYGLTRVKIADIKTNKLVTTKIIFNGKLLKSELNLTLKLDSKNIEI